MAELSRCPNDELQTYFSKNKFKEGSLLFTGMSEKNIYSRMQHMMK